MLQALKCTRDLLGRVVHGVWGTLRVSCGLTLSLRNIINMSNQSGNKAANNCNFLQISIQSLKRFLSIFLAHPVYTWISSICVDMQHNAIYLTTIYKMQLLSPRRYLGLFIVNKVQFFTILDLKRKNCLHQLTGKYMYIDLMLR